MPVRRVRIWPDTALKEIAKPVTLFDQQLEDLVTDLWDTMYAAHGIGLAATQVAVPLQVLVIDLDPKAKAKTDPTLRDELKAWGYETKVVLINPQITAAEGAIEWDEGCLSVPGVTETVTRKDHIVVSSKNLRGQEVRLEAQGLFAVAIQHEMDHLVGKVFVEYLSKVKRDLIRRKMDRLRDEVEDNGVIAAQAL